MAARFGSLSRSFMSSARTSTLRSPPSFLRPPPVSSPHLRPRRPSFAPSRNFGELGCTQSLLPFYCAATMPCLIARLSTELQVSELFHGNNGEDG